MFRFSVAVLLILSLLSPAVEAGASRFTLKAGIGYDYLSQKYFADSLAISGADSILTKYSLTSEYLNDAKAILDLTYHSAYTQVLDLRGRYEQTKDVLRLKVTSGWSRPSQSFDFRWRSQLDWRQLVGESASSLGSYLSGSSTFRVKKHLGESYRLWSQLFAEGTDFYGENDYGFDFYRIGGKAGLERSFGAFSNASLNAFYISRSVSDSTSPNYHGSGVEGSFSGTISRLDLDWMARWESKNYNRPENEDDYTRFELDSRNRVDLGKSWLWRIMSDLDITSFDPADPLNQDYTRFGVRVTLGRELGGLEIGLGPDFELLRQSSDDSSQAEDYTESGGVLDLTYFSLEGGFASVENRLGSRHFAYANEYQSDFTYYELSILGDWPVTPALNFNLILSSLWEWHDRESENSRVILLSSSLLYRF